MVSERDSYLLLNLAPGVRSATVRRLLEQFGSLAAVAQAGEAALARVPRMSPALARHIAEALRQPERLAPEQARARQAGARMVTLADEDYPPALRTLPDPPIVLYIRGSLPVLERAIALVGARQASLYGLQCARQLGYELGLRGIAVISGLARGIDAAAHEGALQAGGGTVAVLGSGLGALYPAEHAGLADRIVAEGGAVMSEYPMATLPEPWRFPQRNRLISGLAQGVVVVEAAARSGALITADCALEQGREVFAVPGPITQPASQGTNRLLKQGARLVMSVDDILEELRWDAPAAVPAAPSAAEGRILEAVAACREAGVDELAEATGLAVPELSAGLVQLELRGRVRQLPGNRYAGR